MGIADMEKVGDIVSPTALLRNLPVFIRAPSSTGEPISANKRLYNTSAGKPKVQVM
jgi:hypothetical protein